ncbi:unnamed protein product [Discula destructiva]
MNTRLSPKATVPNSTTSPLKRRVQDATPDLPSPPASAPSPDRPSKKRKVQKAREEATRKAAVREEATQVETQEEHPEDEDLNVDSDVDLDALRPPQFWDKLTPSIPLVRAAVAELDRRNRKTAYSGPPCLHQTKQRPTDCDLKRYARRGGPDLSDLRAGGEMPSTQESAKGRGPARGAARGHGRVQKAPSKGTHSSKTKEKTSKESKTTTGPYDAAFKQHLINHQIWPIGHYLEESGDEPPPPDNLDVIVEYINGGRASLEPEIFTQSDFADFRRSYRIAASEDAQSRTLELVEGRLSLSATHIKRGPVKFTNLEALTPDNFVPGFPDRVYGSRPEKLHRQLWLSELTRLILPTAAKDLACPNLIVHIKGPAGSPKTANIQAVYDGALAARGMEAMWVFGCEDEAKNPVTEPMGGTAGQRSIARTLTCTFVAGALRIYSVHVHAQSSSVYGAEYVTTPVGAYFLDNTLEDFRRGATAYRNAIEWARMQREEVIERANRRAAQGGSLPALSVDSGSFSSVDPLA